jgi:maltose alpha-D-glucosyltransferase / alpha-amylase
MTLALLQGFVSNQGDGWTFTLDYLARYLQDKQLLEETEHAVTEGMHDTFMAMIRILGSRTGELHMALCKQSGDPAFDPEPITRDDTLSWIGVVRQEATKSFKLLARGLDRLPERARPDAEELLARGDEVFQRLDRLRDISLKAVKTRFHGDYHLGQVLLVQNDFYIIDFEGEPGRPLAERRSKHSPFKDVAGMLRSFNYAAYAALLKVTARAPEDFAILESFAREHEDQAVEAFMLGYMNVAKDCPAYPADPDHAHDLIAFFTLEKALYELRYEINNRPEWVIIPLKGIMGLLNSE